MRVQDPLGFPLEHPLGVRVGAGAQKLERMSLKDRRMMLWREARVGNPIIIHGTAPPTHVEDGAAPSPLPGSPSVQTNSIACES